MNETPPKLSIVIPVYNESRTIADVVDRIKASAQRQKMDAEIIVVNDGSQDGSSEIIRTLSGIVFLDKEKNGGKGSAVKAGFEIAQGDIFLIQDADLEYNPDDYGAVIEPIIKGRNGSGHGLPVSGEGKTGFFREKKIPLSHPLHRQPRDHLADQSALL